MKEAIAQLNLLKKGPIKDTKIVPGGLKPSIGRKSPSSDSSSITKSTGILKKSAADNRR